jgi:lysophospholipase L1-like esterase
MIVFLGDSITEAWDKTYYNQYFSQYQPKNFGVAGYTTRNTIDFIEKTKLHSLTPKVIILLIGTNNTDYSYSPRATFDEIIQILSMLSKLSPDSKIILLGILPRGHTPDKKRMINEQVNRMLKNIRVRNVYYADVGYLFLTRDKIIPRELMYDGLHLTSQGYKIFSEVLSRLISFFYKMS